MAKDEKSAVIKQPNKLQLFYKETVGELKKVNWPTRREALNLTGVVLLVTAVMSAFLGLLDFLFSQGFAILLR